MNSTTLLRRLEEIETRLKPDPLVVVARLDSGEVTKMTMKECLSRQDASFIRVCGGHDLRDLDALLAAMKAEAEAERSEK
jgi:hypothetical protein